MGEITEALRRAKLAEEGQDIFGDSEPEEKRDRDWGGSAIDTAQADSFHAEPAAANTNAEIQIPRTMSGFWIPRAVLVEPPLRAAECFRKSPTSDREHPSSFPVQNDPPGRNG